MLNICRRGPDLGIAAILHLCIVCSFEGRILCVHFTCIYFKLGLLAFCHVRAKEQNIVLGGDCAFCLLIAANVLDWF